MTREEAIGHIKDVICENNTIKPNIVVFEQEKEALYMAIKALEQEPILDKIREEIKVMISNRGFLSYSVRYINNEIDKVFDRYKADKEQE